VHAKAGLEGLEGKGMRTENRIRDFGSRFRSPRAMEIERLGANPGLIFRALADALRGTNHA
jgi:hypothetical protein